MRHLLSRSSLSVERWTFSVERFPHLSPALPCSFDPDFDSEAWPWTGTSKCSLGYSGNGGQSIPVVPALCRRNLCRLFLTRRNDPFRFFSSVPRLILLARMEGRPPCRPRLASANRAAELQGGALSDTRRSHWPGLKPETWNQTALSPLAHSSGGGLVYKLKEYRSGSARAEPHTGMVDTDVEIHRRLFRSLSGTGCFAVMAQPRFSRAAGPAGRSRSRCSPNISRSAGRIRFSDLDQIRI